MASRWGEDIAQAPFLAAADAGPWGITYTPLDVTPSPRAERAAEANEPPAANAAYPRTRVDIMAMVCPQCSTTFQQSAHCPNCGVRLLYRSRRRRGDSHEGESAQ